MGTAKRERQKANRALKYQEVERAQSRRKGLRLAIIVGGAIVAIFALVWVGSAIVGDGDDEPVVDDAFFDNDGSVAEAPAVAETEVPVTTAAPVDPASVGCPPTDGSAEQIQSFDGPPPDCLDPNAGYQALVTTNKGEFTIELDQAKAPQTVNNFVFLARYKYFDGTVCHRIIPGFVVQCGDPTATGTGGPGYQFSDELPNAGEYEIGSVAMANSGPDTNGSQFFIVTGDQGAALPPQYSLFGGVAEGFDDTVTVMEAAGTPGGSPDEDIEIVTIEIIET